MPVLDAGILESELQDKEGVLTGAHSCTKIRGTEFFLCTLQSLPILNIHNMVGSICSGQGAFTKEIAFLLGEGDKCLQTMLCVKLDSKILK